MIRNYLRISLGNMLSHKLFSLINILGLAVGLACCLMISVFVRYEFSYDEFFPGADRIYRLSPDFMASSLGTERHPAGNVAPLAPLVRASGVEGVESIARIGGLPALVSRENQAFYEEAFRWADPEIFDIFQFDWLRGEAAGALASPDSVVISESLAEKYFPGEDALGQTLMLENTWPLTVTGVTRDLPENSHLSASLIVPMETAWKKLAFDYGNNWSYTNFHTYIRLEEEAAPDAVMARVENLVHGSIDGEVAAFFGITPESLSFTAYRLADIHLWSGRSGEFREPGSPAFVLTFSATAACLLLIACINFMNLSTARSSLRAREVGMRKAIGARRRQLVVQFLGESLLLALLAAGVALVMVETLLPVFGALVGRDLRFSMLSDPGFLVFAVCVTLLAGLLAGSYPAFYLSAFNPVRVFRFGAGSAGGLAVRNLLVMFQFFLAISLIVATIVVTLQMRYARNVELGFNKDHVLVLVGTRNEGLGTQWRALKQELLQYPGIVQVTESDMSPGTAGSRQVRIEGGAREGFDMLTKAVGFGFFETYDMELLAGRDFDEARATDVFTPPANLPEGVQPTGAYVLNATAVRELGLTPAEVLGRRFEVDFSSDFSLAVTGPVIGVVEDVHLFSLREPILPLAYYAAPPRWGDLAGFDVASVRLSGDDVAGTVDWVEGKWAEFNPNIPLFHYFLDAEFAALYQDEERQGQLFSLFAALTVIIACLGLFGLASFTAERRCKEIGVRKVMGGSVTSIVLLLTNDFSKLVLAANLLAWPVAYLVMERWLANFAYRIDLTPMIFIGSGAIALSVAWATVGSTAARAAAARPVLALRYE